MDITDYDNDFATYVADEDTRKNLGMVFTPYSIIEQMMDKVDAETWADETKTNLDPTMGTGNIVIGMLYRRIVEYHQDPVKALSNVYGIELDQKTLDYAKDRIKKFIAHFTDKDCSEIIDHNFVCSDIFEWDIENWKPMSQSTGDFESWLE
jgi:hypothetical protein